MSYTERNLSYLEPRDPSIKSWSDRVKLPGPCTKNLIELNTDDFEETIGDNIKVYLRLKPSVSADNPFTVLSSTTVQTEAPKESVSYKNVSNGVGKLIHKFSFTSILDQNTTQGELFKKCAVNNLKKFLSGENYLLMAYGTTSAGKTYTMQGNVEHPGVIPRALDYVFTALKDNIIPMCRYSPYQYKEFLELSEEKLRKDFMQKNLILSLDLTKYQRYPDATVLTLQTNSSSGFSESYENITFKEMQSNLVVRESLEIESQSYQYSVWISMVEIYNEQVYDLLEVPNEKGARPKLTFKDDKNGNTFLKNLRYVNVSSGHEAFQILQFGRSNLHLAPTALNHRSSRSHCIFTITLAKFLDYEVSSHAIISRFSFCDLAGMERAKKTLNVRDRLMESKAINTSLSILVKCFTTIKENQNSREKKMIPFRESKLTKLFRDAVMGKEQFSLIVNVTTEPNLFDETLSVLKFSAIAQKIVPQNVFAKPKIAKVEKRSRFSRIVVNSSYNKKTLIDWEESTATHTKLKEDYSSSDNGMEELKVLVEALREELAQEKIKCERIEMEIREELTTEFSEILKKQNEHHQSRLKNETERLQEMYEKKERRLVQFCEMLRKNKRPKLDDDLSDYEDDQNNVKDLEKTVESLRSEHGSLKKQLQELQGEYNKLKVECSELKFKSADKDRALEALRRTHKAYEEGGDALEKELRKQLDEANTKISKFKSLLDEAASDYKDLEELNQFLRNENAINEQHLTEHREIVADLRNENAELQKMLSQKRIMIEKLESANERLKADMKIERDQEWKEGDFQSNNHSKEMEVLQEELKKTSESLERIREECENLKVEKLNLEKDLEISKLKIADLESKVLTSEENSCREEKLEATLEEIKEEVKRLKEFESKATELAKEKHILEEKCKELESEVKALQKEVKDLLGFSKRENALSEFESLKKENEVYQKESLDLKKTISGLEAELQRQTEKLINVERESKLALKNLHAKFEAVEFQNSVMKNLKDEAERQAYEVPQFHEKIKKLEKEIENREKDMAAFKENRNEIFNNYEKELTKLREENEKLRNDFMLANEANETNMAFLRTNEAEINKLQESVKKREEEIDRLKAEVKSIKKPKTESVKKQETCESIAELKESSSKENSPFVSLKKHRKKKEKVEEVENSLTKRENSFERLSKQIEKLAIQQSEPKSTRKKVDLLEETIHPSTIKNGNKGRKKKENGKKEKEAERALENEKKNGSVRIKGKCYKKLFTDNDFNEQIDLASPSEEISRLRPRK